LGRIGKFVGVTGAGDEPPDLFRCCSQYVGDHPVGVTELQGLKNFQHRIRARLGLRHTDGKLHPVEAAVARDFRHDALSRFLRQRREFLFGIIAQDQRPETPGRTQRLQINLIVRLEINGQICAANSGRSVVIINRAARSTFPVTCQRSAKAVALVPINVQTSGADRKIISPVSIGSIASVSRMAAATACAPAAFSRDSRSQAKRIDSSQAGQFKISVRSFVRASASPCAA
jgi:hypothetical protein